MAIRTITKWNFECVNCQKYVTPNKKGYIGLCTIEDKRVSRTHTCLKNPLHITFWFFIHGIPLEQIIGIPDEELREIREQILEDLSEFGR